jgi:ZIP family zinc transporter
MLEALLWGALGASALLIGALVAYRFAPSRRVIAAVMALGTGLLIGSVSFELIDEALKTQNGRLGRAARVGGRGCLLRR